MSKRRLVITAVLAGASQSEVARTYGVSQGWISRLMTRYRDEGEAAFEPRSRQPLTSPAATAAPVVDLVLGLRKELAEQGLDAGADSIVWHLTHRHQVTVSRATIHRILVRELRRQQAEERVAAEIVGALGRSLRAAGGARGTRVVDERRRVYHGAILSSARA